MRVLQETVPAPAEMGVALIGVPEGSSIDLEVRLEAVHEGILVTGEADVDIVGECGRCLEPIEYSRIAEFQELFYYEPFEEGAEDEESEQHLVLDDYVDVEPVLRDAVVTALPFQPVCREDCEGLCPDCGERLEEDPDHHHEVLDPRWAALSGLLGTTADSADERIDSVEREER